MNKILDFAKQILAIPSPTGYSIEAIEFLEKEAKKRNLPYSKNRKGNLIIELKGKTEYTIALSAHVDTLGAMVRSINSNGTLRFSVLGGPILPTYDGEYCTIITRNGKKYRGTFLSNAPAVHVYKNSKTLERTEENMHIRLDEVVKTKKDVEKLQIGTGDFIALDPKTEITPSGFIKSRFLDDKISVAILFGLIDHLLDNQLELKPTLKFIFSTYEEMGHGASNIPQADEMIAVDMGCIGEDLSCTEQDVSICVKDSSGPYDYGITNELIRIAKQNNINHAVDVYPYYGSDVTAALHGGNDIKGGLIGPGVSASHGMERTHKDAVEASLQLLIHYLQK
jgi:putative aminopeptidase FrvX